jgi:hypothetical protein
MFVIYEKSSTFIMGYRNGTVRPDHRKTYKTMASARAALTRWSHQWWHDEGRHGDCIDNNPHFRYAIARKNHFHDTIEKKVRKTNLLDDSKSWLEGVNTPSYMSPSSESYWSM